MLLALSPLSVFLLHVLLSRLTLMTGTSVSPQLTTVYAILAGYPVHGILSWILGLSGVQPRSELWIAGAYGFVVYTCLSYSYFHLFNMTETARRYRVLMELNAHGPMTLHQIEEKYKPQDMLKVRLERLVQTGQIKRVDDRYALKGRLLFRAALVVRAWTKFLSLPLEVDTL